MPPPGPFTLFAQSFAAALMSWWMRLILGREEREMMEGFFAKLHGTMGRLDDIFAMWKAGTLPPPPPEPEPRPAAARMQGAVKPRGPRLPCLFPAPRGRETGAPEPEVHPLRPARRRRFIRPVRATLKRQAFAPSLAAEWSG